MRNLKRALSLTLASVMLLGMMVIGTSAASYPDVDENDNVEAIEVLQAVGVMQGDDKGNFDPDRTVSRNEMAIVMAKLLNLDYNYYSESCPFWDVPDYAKPYVGACYANGIVSGYNANTYGGADTVTAVQAASMMMRALGYFQYDSDYADGFVISTVRQASKIGIFKDINAGQETPLTRNQVAQLALNTLETGMVEARKSSADISIGSGDTAVTINGAVEYVYVTSDEDYADDIDDVNATSVGTINDSYIVELGEKLYEGKLKRFGDKTNNPAEIETDDMGRPAVRWVYNNQDVGTYVEQKDAKFSYTAKAAKGDMYTKIGPSVADSLIKGDGKYALEVWVDGAKLAAPDAKNYFEKNNSSAAGVKSFVDDTNTTRYAGVSGNGVLTEVFVVDDGYAKGIDKVVIVMTNTYLVKATADYNSSTELVNIEPVAINTDEAKDYQIQFPPVKTTISSDDFNVADVKEDDYLLITWSYDTKDYVTVKPAELLTGKVSEYTVSDYVIMDSNKYSYNKIVGKEEKSDEYSINQDAKVVLDSYGYIIFVDEAISTSSFVYIQDVAGATNLSKNAIASAYFGDGTSAEIELKKVVVNGGTEHTSGAWMSKDENVHGWYTYIKDSDGKYVLTEAQNTKTGRTTNKVYNAEVPVRDEATQIVFNSKVRFLQADTTSSKPYDANITAATNDDGTSVIANAKTVFLALDDDEEVTVDVGVANAPEVFIVSKDAAVPAGKLQEGVEVNWVTGKDGYAQYVFIDVSRVKSNVDSATNAADYLFILDDTDNKTVDTDGNTYYKFKVVIDGVETERFIEETNVAQVGDLRYNVKTNSKDYITKASLVTHHNSKNTHEVWDLKGSIIEQKNSTITIKGQRYIIGQGAELNLVVGEGVTQLLVDDGADYELYKNTTAATIASLADQAGKDMGVDGKAYVVVDENGSDVIEVLWVYIDGVSKAGGDVPPAPEKDYDVTVNFTADQAEVKNGDAKVNSGDKITVKGGETLDLTITAKKGYVIESVKLGDETLTGKDGVYTISKAGTVTVTTAEVPAQGHTLTLKDGATTPKLVEPTSASDKANTAKVYVGDTLIDNGGTVVEKLGYNEATYTVKAGTKVTIKGSGTDAITAIGDGTYIVDGVAVTVSGTNKTIEFTMPDADFGIALGNGTTGDKFVAKDGKTEIAGGDAVGTVHIGEGLTVTAKAGSDNDNKVIKIEDSVVYATAGAKLIVSGGDYGVFPDDTTLSVANKEASTEYTVSAGDYLKAVAKVTDAGSNTLVFDEGKTGSNAVTDMFFYKGAKVWVKPASAANGDGVLKLTDNDVKVGDKLPDVDAGDNGTQITVTENITLIGAFKITKTDDVKVEAQDTARTVVADGKYVAKGTDVKVSLVDTEDTNKVVVDVSGTAGENNGVRLAVGAGSLVVDNTKNTSFKAWTKVTGADTWTIQALNKLNGLAGTAQTMTTGTSVVVGVAPGTNVKVTGAKNATDILKVEGEKTVQDYPAKGFEILASNASGTNAPDITITVRDKALTITQAAS